VNNVQTPLLLAHYKAYHPIEETTKAIQTLLDLQFTSNLTACFAVPFTHIKPLSEKFKDHNVWFGGELMLNVSNGSFPAAVADKILKNSGANFVLIGSADERKIYTPYGLDLQKKITKAFASGVMPIVCVGETEQEYQDGLSKSVLTEQLTEFLHAMETEETHDLHILYDAGWISRSSWLASSQDLQNAYKAFQEAVNEVFPENLISRIKLIYAVPAFSSDLAQIMQTLPNAGYSLGLLDATTGLSPELSIFISNAASEIEPSILPESDVAQEIVDEISEITDKIEVVQELEQELPEEKIAKPKAPRKPRKSKKDVSDNPQKDE